MQQIIDWVVNLMSVLGAPGVGVAILLENLFPPIPSEVVLPLAGFTVASGEMSFIAALIWSTIGAVVGALILYWIGAAIGARRLYNIAEWMWLVEGDDVTKSLVAFDKYGSASVFFGRFIPGIRSLISIPAGIDRMPLPKFIAWTTVGSFIWNAVLIALGYWLGDAYTKVADVIDSYSTVVYAIIALILVAILVYLVRRYLRMRKTGDDPDRDLEAEEQILRQYEARGRRKEREAEES